MNAAAGGERARGAPRSIAALASLVLAAAIVFVALVWLCVWQLERRQWKHDLIAAVNARVHAKPAAAPGPAMWPAITADHDAYRRVTVSGRFVDDRETAVQAVTELGPGFWILTPLRTDAGFTVLVDRGFVPADRRDPATRTAIAGEARVTGLLRITEPGGGFLRRNDPAADRWYSRDVAAIARARHLGPVAPYFIDADATANPGGSPVGGLTVIAFPDNHLQYALTWFALALLLAGASGWVARDEWRLRRRNGPV